MARCLRRVFRVLRPGGYAVYVVSNSVLREVEIDTAKGYHRISVGRRFKTRKSLFPGNTSGTQVFTSTPSFTR